jgi:hypothetical protein
MLLYALMVTPKNEQEVFNGEHRFMKRQWPEATETTRWPYQKSLYAHHAAQY